MTVRKVPVEIAGYVDRPAWVEDHVSGVVGFRLISWANDDHGEDDFLPWEGDSVVDDCPF